MNYLDSLKGSKEDDPSSGKRRNNLVAATGNAPRILTNWLNHCLFSTCYDFLKSHQLIGGSI